MDIFIDNWKSRCIWLVVIRSRDSSTYLFLFWCAQSQFYLFRLRLQCHDERIWLGLPSSVAVFGAVEQRGWVESIISRQPNQLARLVTEAGPFTNTNEWKTWVTEPLTFTLTGFHMATRMQVNLIYYECWTTNPNNNRPCLYYFKSTCPLSFLP